MDIAQIKSLLGERKIGWSLHSAQMMQKRAISRLDVLSCLENGEIIEQGNHEELLAEKGYYYNTLNAQLKEQ